jgi:hypothetical protein
MGWPRCLGCNPLNNDMIFSHRIDGAGSRTTVCSRVAYVYIFLGLCQDIVDCRQRHFVIKLQMQLEMDKRVSEVGNL